MKRIKLLTPIISSVAIVSTIAPLTSCSQTQEQHIWLTSIEESQKDTNKNFTVYHFGLDSNNYEDKDIEVRVLGTNYEDLKATWTVSGNVLTVKVEYIGKFEYDTKYQIPVVLKIATKNWYNVFQLQMNMYIEPDLDTYIDRYTTARNNFLKNEQSGGSYNTFDLSVGDYHKQVYQGQTTYFEVKSDTIQNNAVEYKKDPETGPVNGFCGKINIHKDINSVNNVSYNKTPEQEKQGILDDIAAGGKYSFIILPNNNWGYYYEKITEFQTDEKIIINDINGYSVTQYKYVIMPSIQYEDSRLINYINYRKV